MGRLEGINKRMTIDGMDHALQRLQTNLWVELEEIILQEDLMWAQKARCDWFSLGDKNSSYFHKKANARRKRNRIDALLSESGDWVYDVEIIKQEALSFYTKLFTEEDGACPTIVCDVGFPESNPMMLTTISNRVSQSEVENVIKFMGPLKAP